MVSPTSAHTVNTAAVEARPTQAQADMERLNSALRQLVAERTAELDRRMTQLRALATQIHRVEQRERAKLARVLHDDLQQLLVAAMIQLDVALANPPATASVEQASKLVREAIEASRSLTSELSPPVLYEGSIASAMNWLARHMSERHGLKVHVQCSKTDALEGLSEDRRVLLFQSVRELLFNVAKHAGVDSARIAVDIDHRRVEVTVEDHGHGLRMSQSQAEQTGGTGFGLLGMRERLEYVGGNLVIDSQPHRYTRVTMWVPLDPQPLSVGASATPEAPFENHKKLRVLLADNHQVLREGLAELLRGESDIDVVGEACDGRQAVELALRLHPDVVVMDIAMPQLNGIESTRQILQVLPETRIVSLSRHEEDDLTTAMLEAGAESYVTKGGPSKDLIEAIHGQPRRHPSQQRRDPRIQTIPAAASAVTRRAR